MSKNTKKQGKKSAGKKIVADKEITAPQEISTTPELAITEETIAIPSIAVPDEPSIALLPQAFLDKLAEFGIPEPPEAITCDGFLEWADDCYAIGIGNGFYFGKWSVAIKGTWFPDKKPRGKQGEKRDADIDTAEILHRGLQAQAAKEAQEQWETLSENGQSSYLTRKQVGAYGIRFLKSGNSIIKSDTAVVPLRNENGEIVSLQSIYASGEKILFRRGRKKGCFHTIGVLENGKPILVAEGYATAASGHEAMDMPVVMAIDAGNLLAVVTTLHRLYSLVARVASSGFCSF